MNTKSKIIDWYSIYAWPVVRHFLRVSKRCRRCILSEKYAPLEGGLCPECLRIESSPVNPPVEASTAMQEEFSTLLTLSIDEKPYHVALMLSGGKDSAYILYRLRAEFPGLRILSLIVNNGFMSPFAIDNARLAAEKCSSDLLVVNSQTDTFAKAFRRAFCELDGRGSYGVIDFADGDLIFTIGKKIAIERDIPILIGGLSWVQVQKILGFDGFELSKPGDPKIIFPLSVWRTHEQEIRKFVREKKLLAKGTDSPIVSNSVLSLVMSAVDVLNLGYCSFEPEFAQLVREGKTDRKTWLYAFELLEFATKKGILKKDIEIGLERLGLSLSDVVKRPA